MRLLVVGGTQFLGRHVVAAALGRGHTVTTFNRGKTNPDLFPEAERIRGDRNGDLSALRGRTWDAAIDTCAYFPRQVRAMAEALQGTIGHFAFVSSLSVYAEFASGMDELGPLARLADPSVEEITGETYGGLKVLCEEAAEAGFPGRALLAGPGFLVGPHDPINRFPYWVERIARGGQVLVPGGPERPVQLIDARDLALWLVSQAEAGTVGPFNLTGRPIPFADMLGVVAEAAGASPTYAWASDGFLTSHGVEPDGLPYWVPEAEAAFSRVGIDRALAHGLSFRPLLETARDTLEWLKSRPTEALLGSRLVRGGITPERESELLAEYRPTSE
jgi:2'-hydroxyisoflavone reductase